MDWYIYVYFIGGCLAGALIGWLTGKLTWMPRWLTALIGAMLILPYPVNLYIDLEALRGLLETYAGIGIGIQVIIAWSSRRA